MKKTSLLTCLLTLWVLGTHAIERPEALIGGKQLVVNMTNGQTYHYLVSSLDNPVIHRLGDRIAIGTDTMLLSEVRSLRFKSMQHYLLDEDSTAFGADYAVDHGLMAFRRTLHTGQWNSLTVPFALTGQQVRQTFGDDARLAVVSGMTGGDVAAVEFTSIDLQTDEQVVKPGAHYILWPTREPDYGIDDRLPYNWNGTRAYGPLYLLPMISLNAKQTKPTGQNVYGNNRQQHVYISGTYARLDGTYKQGVLVKNKKVKPGAYVFNEQGSIEQHADSTLLLAFRSWFEDLSDEPSTLHFYVDGVADEDLAATTAVPAVPYTAKVSQSTEPIYDLQGRRVEAAQLRKGIYIIRGKKQIVK
jgi:hypothetical protein